jgi:hypothetical protein
VVKRKSWNQVLLVIGLSVVVAGCVAPVDPAFRQACGSDWGSLHKGLPESRLKCAFQGYQPYVDASTSRSKYWKGFMLDHRAGYVITVDGKVADWGS